MNIYVPQGLEARAEAQELLLTSQNVTSQQRGQALVSLWQDARLGCFLMLTAGAKGCPVLFNRWEACQLLMGLPNEPASAGGMKPSLRTPPKSGLEKKWENKKGVRKMLLPDPPARQDLNGDPLYGADQILCAALPDGFGYESEEDGVQIQNGRALFYGDRMGATWLGDSRDGLVATLWRT